MHDKENKKEASSIGCYRKFAECHQESFYNGSNVWAESTGLGVSGRTVGRGRHHSGLMFFYIDDAVDETRARGGDCRVRLKHAGTKRKVPQLLYSDDDDVYR